MSAFVDPEKTYDITVYWRPNPANANKLTILEKAPAATEPPCETMAMSFRYPDYAMERRIMDQSTVVGPNGPMINALVLQSVMLYTLAKSWTLKDDKGGSLPIDSAAISALNPAIVRTLVGALHEEMSQAGLF